MVNTDELMSVAESLPVDIKIELIEGLIASLNPNRKDIDELWAEEAEKRINELKTGEAKRVPGEEVFREIRKNLTE